MAKNKNKKEKPKGKTEGVAEASKQIGKSLNGNEKVKAKKEDKSKALSKELAAVNIPKVLDPEKIAKKKAKKLKQKLRKQTEQQAEQKDGTTAADANVEQSKKPQNSPKKARNSPKKAQNSPKKPQNSQDAKDKPKQAAGKKQSKQPKPAEEKVRVKLNTDEANDKTIFVGNLPTNTKRVQLIRLFQQCGKVLFTRFRTASGKNIFKHKARKEAGALNAYIVLETVEGARKALDLNGSVFKGNHLRITRADKKTTQVSEDMEAKRTIFVGNLKYTCTEDSLHEIFTSCGEIDYVRCLRDDKGCKGVAYVLFKSPDAVGLALELNGSNLDDRPIHVERYSVKKLGAKQARDEAAPKEGTVKKRKNLTGASKRLDIKNKKAHKNAQSKETSTEKKKSEFRGVKVDGIKKKKDKKKSNNQMKQLAKKIAPKT